MRRTGITTLGSGSARLAAHGCVALVCWLGLLGPAVPAAPPTPAELQGKGCLAAGCHASLKEHNYLHPPASQGDCALCHQPLEAEDGTTTQALHQFTTPPPDLDFCSQCHTSLNADHLSVHEPFRGACTVCHDPHGGKVRYYLEGADTVGDLCLTCHAGVLEDHELLHAPVALKACSSCHVPHASDQPALLARPPDQLCVFCHMDFGRGLRTAVSVHAPARESCFACHNPHGGTVRGFLPVAQEALCASCHAEQIERMTESAYPHHAMIEGRDCSDCHDAHWAASSKLLKQPSLQICLECHTTALTAQDGRTIAGIGEQLAQHTYQHGPIQQQDCTPCHAAHGSEDPRLMKAAFPSGFYAAYTRGAYALCFGCHNEELVESERTLATGFREGDWNLHYVHVHQEKGRSCRACHAEHSSDAPFHMRESVPFGDWKLKIEFEQTATGGTCQAGCHKPRSYDREPAAVSLKAGG